MYGALDFHSLVDAILACITLCLLFYIFGVQNLVVKMSERNHEVLVYGES